MGKIIQIATEDDCLYALDDDGQIWKRPNIFLDHSYWTPVSLPGTRSQEEKRQRAEWENA